MSQDLIHNVLFVRVTIRFNFFLRPLSLLFLLLSLQTRKKNIVQSRIILVCFCQLNIILLLSFFYSNPGNSGSLSNLLCAASSQQICYNFFPSFSFPLFWSKETNIVLQMLMELLQIGLARGKQRGLTTEMYTI